MPFALTKLNEYPFLDLRQHRAYSPVELEFHQLLYLSASYFYVNVYMKCTCTADDDEGDDDKYGNTDFFLHWKLPLPYPVQNLPIHFMLHQLIQSQIIRVSFLRCFKWRIEKGPAWENYKGKKRVINHNSPADHHCNCSFFFSFSLDIFSHIFFCKIKFNDFEDDVISFFLLLFIIVSWRFQQQNFVDIIWFIIDIHLFFLLI